MLNNLIFHFGTRGMTNFHVICSVFIKGGIEVIFALLSFLTSMLINKNNTPFPQASLWKQSINNTPFSQASLWKQSIRQLGGLNDNLKKIHKTKDALLFRRLPLFSCAPCSHKVKVSHARVASLFDC